MELQLAANRKQQAALADVGTYASETALEYGETVARLHEKGERTLFLQFALYRLCEADLNDTLVGPDGFPTDCGSEKTMADASVAFATSIEESAAQARTQTDTDRKAAVAAQASSQSAKAQVELAVSALAKLQAEKAPKAKIQAARSTLAAARKAAVEKAAASQEASRQLASSTKLAASYAEGLGVAVRIVGEDRDAYRQCRASLGTGSFERKYSEVLASAVELWSFEAKAAAARAAAEQAKAKGEGAKAKVKELELKANQAATKLDALESTALETMVSTPKATPKSN